MFYRSIFLAACLASVAGCASAPTAAEQASADYGPPIAQADAEIQAREYLRTRLKDPMSAVYEFGTVYRGWRAGGMGRPTAYGYILEAKVNAKNAFGGYTGLKPYQFLFRNGAVAVAYGEECLAPGSCYMAPLP